MDLMLPAAVWVPAALVAGAVALGLVADGLGRRAVAVGIIALGLIGAGAAGFYHAITGEAGVAVGSFASGAGFTSLPSVGYVLAGFAVVAGYRRYATWDRGPAMAGLVALGAIFAHALLASLDIVVLFVSLAGLAIVGYSLVAGAGTREAEESAIRYFVQGAVATGLTVYGFALVLGLGGSTSYLEAGAALGGAPARPALLALGLVLSVFAFKLGAFPFHAWVPDAYDRADAPSVAFLASAPKIAGVVALLVLVRGTLFESGVFAPASQLLSALAIGSLLFGSFGMLRQTRVARLLGYSAIAQIGYALLAIAAGDAGVRAASILVLTYAIGAAGAFIALEAVQRVRPAWDGSLDGLAGLSREAPLLSGALAAIMLSLTGIPLLAGFWGKLYVFIALVDSGMVWLAVGAGVAAVVSFGGYGSVIRAMYFGPEPDVAAEMIQEADAGTSQEGERGGSPLAVTIVLGLIIIGLGVAPLVLGLGPVFSLFSL
ncbi:MAG TPA: proton-conducting transporter membrane subunit [Coriobacteriia bacterium]|nr:proton-conducting transporter membrane subunit [Coriobacteriia bacterium]